MANRSYDRKCIALEQLETALHLWFDQSAYFSVITLAGAAEEIFGKCPQAAGIDNAFESLRQAVESMHRHLFSEEPDPALVARRANYARNQSKHFDPGASRAINIDVREEARDMLNRAIDNYWRLELNLSPAMTRFQHDEHAA